MWNYFLIKKHINPNGFEWYTKRRYRKWLLGVDRPVNAGIHLVAKRAKLCDLCAFSVFCSIAIEHMSSLILNHRALELHSKVSNLNTNQNFWARRACLEMAFRFSLSRAISIRQICCRHVGYWNSKGSKDSTLLKAFWGSLEFFNPNDWDSAKQNSAWSIKKFT